MGGINDSPHAPRKQRDGILRPAGILYSKARAEPFGFGARLLLYFSLWPNVFGHDFRGVWGDRFYPPILAYFTCPARRRISARMRRKAMAKVVVVTVTAVRSATGSARMTASTLFTGSAAGRI